MTDKRLLRLIGVLICLMACSGLVRAEQAMFQGELEVSSWETHVAGGSYQVTGKFTDRSVSGFVGTDVGTNDLVFTESELGDVDAWSVTNVSSSTVTGMVVDVEFVGTGGATTSRVGMVAGVAALCTLSTNNAGFAMQPSRTGARLSVSMDNAIRNFNLRRIMDSDLTGYVTTNDTRELDWTGADIRIADATETNQPVTKAQLDAHAGVITNLLSSDGSVDITDIDGPEPDLSVTGYVAEVVGGYVPTNDADFLSIARTMTNWMHVPSSTNWLYYDTSTRLLSGCVTNDTDIGATNIVAGAEDSYTEATRTLTWNTNAAGGGGVETLNDLTGDLQVTGRTNVTVTADGTNIFLDAEGGVADLSGWSGYPATQDVDFATFELSDISTLKLGTDYREITSGTILLDAGLINVDNLNRVRSVGATIMSLTSTNDYTGLCFAPDGIDSFNVSNATNAVSISVAEDDGLARLGVGTWAEQYRLSVKGDTWVDGDLTITTNINAGALNLTGNLSMGAKSITDATNVTTHALTITGGSPTNGAVWVATDTTGQGTWSALPKIDMTSDSGGTTVFPDDELTKVVFNSINAIYGGAWSNNEWVPGVVGWCSVSALTLLRADLGTIEDKLLYSYLVRNGATFRRGAYNRVTLPSNSFITIGGSWVFYNSIATNAYSFWVRQNFGNAHTNFHGDSHYFSGAVLP